MVPGQHGVIQSLDGFAISWPLTAAYGTIILVAIVDAVLFLTGAIAAASGVNFTEAISIFLLIALLTQLLARYFVGRWGGARCRNRGIIAIFVMAFLSAILGRTTDFLLTPADDFQKLFGVEKSMTLFFTGTFFSFVLLLLPALLGYWRGSRLRMEKYLRFLLAILPADTQATLIDLAFQEANRVRLQGTKT